MSALFAYLQKGSSDENKEIFIVFMCRNQLARSKEMIELEKQYRLEMGEAAQKFAATLTQISTDAREKILTLYIEKKNYILIYRIEKKRL